MWRSLIVGVALAMGVALVGVVRDAVASGPTHQTAARLDTDDYLAISQDAIGKAVGDYRFVASDGSTVRLSELRGRPVVVSLIYTSCNHVCPVITQRLLKAVSEAHRSIGDDRFVVLTIGFDTKIDTPPRMASYARAQGISLPGWRLLSGDAKTVAALAKDLGFVFEPTAGGFAHPSQITVLNSEGVVHRQVYGDDFPIQAFIEPLKEVVYGTALPALNVRSIIDRVRFICTVYDPNQDRYRFDYSIIMTAFTGLLSLGAVGFVLVRILLKQKRS